jgi:type IV pilus assembly protein PilM
MMSGSTVSLYIDDTGIRVMVTRGKRITRLADMPLEAGLSSIDTPQKEAQLAGKIRQLLKVNRIGEKKIILGLSGLHCLTRPINLPELPKAMIGEAVVREARRQLPMPLEQLYLSWQVISVSGGKTSVFLVAVPRQIADTVIRVINKAGCKPYLMDIKPLALARISREATSVILDVQSKEFDIVIMVNGIPQPIRTIAFPQEALSLADKFNIIKEDLKRTLDFVKSKADEKQIGPDTTVFVSGELAEHPELYETLTLEIGLKTAKLASPLKYLKYLEPSLYLVNSGLALKVMAKDAGPLLPNFNTLPTPYLPRHISMNKLMTVPVAAGAVAVLLLLVLSVQNAAAEIEKVQGQIDNTGFMLTKKLADKKEMSQQISALEKQITGANSEYDLYNAAIKRLSVTGNNMNNDVNTTVNSIVKGLDFSGMFFTDAVITIKGYAENEEQLFKYVRDLTDSGRFKEITIVNVILTGDGADDKSIDYSLNCMLKEDRK